MDSAKIRTSHSEMANINNNGKITVLLKLTLEKAGAKSKLSKVVNVVDAWSRPKNEEEANAMVKAIVLAAKDVPKTIDELAALIVEYKGT